MVGRVINAVVRDLNEIGAIFGMSITAPTLPDINASSILLCFLCFIVVGYMVWCTAVVTYFMGEAWWKWFWENFENHEEEEERDATDNLVYVARPRGRQRDE